MISLLTRNSIGKWATCRLACGLGSELVLKIFSLVQLGELLQSWIKGELHQDDFAYYSHLRALICLRHMNREP